jgi:hypothetical protein
MYDELFKRKWRRPPRPPPRFRFMLELAVVYQTLVALQPPVLAGVHERVTVPPELAMV